MKRLNQLKSRKLLLTLLLSVVVLLCIATTNTFNTNSLFVLAKDDLKSDAPSHSHHSHEHSHDHIHQHDHRHTSSPSQLAILHAFFPKDPAYAALTATAYVSLAPIATMSFAVGSLLGDVFLHLLPHAFAPHSHEHEHEHEHEHSHEHGHKHEHSHDNHDHDHTRGLYIGLAVLGGFMTFFSIDRGMRLLSGSSEGGHSHSHHHSSEDEKSQGHSSAVASSDNNNNSTGRKPNGSSTNTASFSLQLSAYLNLLADATHNFTDGLAMAAAFYASPVACFFHEIPHEIGDYAILLRSGFGRFRAAAAQAITALGHLPALLNDVDLVMPFTAGGFIYVATVGVVPELLAARGVTLRHSIMQVIAMSIGVALMTLIALNE
ncbi:ZIP zinc transporter-domain-containing protein [Syncephalis fuscata]|nr:ZIP zinc transporter-domain-containing protein [Syncephalis fuscata]